MTTIDHRFRIDGAQIWYVHKYSAPDFVHETIFNRLPFPQQLLNGMSKMIRECWHPQANVRLPALRIKKTLQKLAATVDDVKTNLDSEVYVRIDTKNTNFV